MSVSWPGNGGTIHRRILEKMREILLSEKAYPYLLPKAKKRLEEARTLAGKFHLEKRSLIPLGDSQYVLFPWLGTKGSEAIKRLLEKQGKKLCIHSVQGGRGYYITFRCEKDASSIIRALSESVTNELSPLDLISEGEHLVFARHTITMCIDRQKPTQTPYYHH